MMVTAQLSLQSMTHTFQPMLTQTFLVMVAALVERVPLAVGAAIRLTVPVVLHQIMAQAAHHPIPAAVAAAVVVAAEVVATRHLQHQAASMYRSGLFYLTLSQIVLYSLSQIFELFFDDDYLKENLMQDLHALSTKHNIPLWQLEIVFEEPMSDEVADGDIEKAATRYRKTEGLDTYKKATALHHWRRLCLKAAETATTVDELRRIYSLAPGDG